MPLPKKPLTNVNRQPQGVPVAGQFAPNAHAEPDVSLSAAEPFFTDADNDPDIMANAPAFDGDTGDEPANDLLGGDSGNGGPPPAGGGSGGDDDEQKKASQSIVFTAAGKHKQLEHARTISLSADHRGNLRVDDVADENGTSIQLEYKDAPLAGSLQLEINANVPGGHGLPARHIIGDRKSVSIDARALLDNDIKIVGLGKLNP